MSQAVTVVLVARDGAEYLERTVSAIAAQTRRPDAVIAVDASSTDRSAQLLGTADPAQLITAPSKSSFGDAVSIGLHGVAPADTDNEWLWLLAHDSAPEPRALQQLLAAVEIAPSVAIAGPKLMRWDQPDVIAEFGESITRLGASMPLVENELDQAQHDVSDDVLGVAATGMLVRRSLWAKLGGLDRGLPTVDAGLDFSIRARLAGSRVVLVPGARVASAGGAELFGHPSVSAAKRAGIIRAAQLHRRLVYAPAAAVPIHWLSLLPLAIVRMLAHLLGKRPGAIAGEFSAALRTAFGRGGIAAARRNLKRVRVVGWGSIAPLRVPWSEVRERRADRREATASANLPRQSEPKISFISGGGFVVVAFAALAGLIAFGPLLGSPAVSGGGLLSLDPNVGALWSKLGYGWREIGTGFTGAADPFVAVLAVAGTLTFWTPSNAVVLFYFAALPLAATAAWFAARRLSVRGWVPSVAAVLWVVAPPFLSSLTSGHLGASIAHVLLPWLALTVINGARSWPAAASAALLFAVVAASAPVLIPVLLIAWLAWMFAQPRGIHRLIGIPLPAAALFAPLVIEQVRVGNPLALLADPGVPAPSGSASAWQLALGSPDGALGGWVHLLDRFGLPELAAPIVVAALLVVPVVLALLAAFMPGTRRAVPALVILLLGFALAVASTRIEVSALGGDTVSIWAGSALSLFWLGLVGCAVVSLEALGRAGTVAGTAAVATVVVLAVPLVISGYIGTSAVAPSSGRIVPAVVDVESATNPQIGTLLLVPEGGTVEQDDRIAVVLQRGVGATLDDQSTLAATRQQLSETDAQLATLAGNLASRSGYDPAADLEELGIGFLVLAEADRADESSIAVHKRVQLALEGSDHVSPIGQSANGLLWRIVEPNQPSATAAHVGNTGTPFGISVLIVQGVIVFLTLLLAIPTSRRHRKVRATANSLEGPATTFDEEDDA